VIWPHAFSYPHSARWCFPASSSFSWFDQGKLEAEKIYQQALEEMEKAWGPDRTSPLNTVNNLGSLYKH
jgi:hypothetical protein